MKWAIFCMPNVFEISEDNNGQVHHLLDATARMRWREDTRSAWVNEDFPTVDDAKLGYEQRSGNA
jgi:hypothetical protein